MVSLFDFEESPQCSDESECIKKMYKNCREYGDSSAKRLAPYHDLRTRKYSQRLTDCGITHSAQWKGEEGGKEKNILGNNVDAYFTTSPKDKGVIVEYKAPVKSFNKNRRHFIDNLCGHSEDFHLDDYKFCTDILFCSSIPICKQDEKDKNRYTIEGFDTPECFLRDYKEKYVRKEEKWAGTMPMFTIVTIFSIDGFDEKEWIGKEVDEFFEYIINSELVECHVYDDMATDYLFINEDEKALDKICEMMK